MASPARAGREGGDRGCSQAQGFQSHSQPGRKATKTCGRLPGPPHGLSWGPEGPLLRSSPEHAASTRHLRAFPTIQPAAERDKTLLCFKAKPQVGVHHTGLGPSTLSERQQIPWNLRAGRRGLQLLRPFAGWTWGTAALAADHSLGPAEAASGFATQHPSSFPPLQPVTLGEHSPRPHAACKAGVMVH